MVRTVIVLFIGCLRAECEAGGDMDSSDEDAVDDDEDVDEDDSSGQWLVWSS